MRGAAALIVLIAGCGRVAFDAASDASPDGQLDALDGQTAAQVLWAGGAGGAVENAPITQVATAAAVLAQPNDLYLAVVSVKPSRPVSMINGLSLPWTLVAEQCSGRDTARLAVYWALGPAPIAGVVTAELNGDVAFTGSAVIAVQRFSNVDVAMPIGMASSANTNGVDASAGCAGGVDSAAYAWSATAGASSSLMFVGVHTAKYMHEPGASFTELSDEQSANSTTAAGVATETRSVGATPSAVPVAGSFGGSNPDWAAISVELRDSH